MELTALNFVDVKIESEDESYMVDYEEEDIVEDILIFLTLLTKRQPCFGIF